MMVGGLGTIGYLIALLAAVWVIYDVWAKNSKLNMGIKVLWTVLALLFSIITAIVYAIMYYGMKK